MQNIFVFLLVPICAGSTNDCPSFLGMKPYQIIATFKHVRIYDLKVAWQIDGDTLSKCEHDTACIDFDSTETETSIKNLEHGIYESTIILKILPNKFMGLWELSYLGPAQFRHPQAVYSCNLKLLEPNILYTTTDKNDEIDIQPKILDITTQKKDEIDIQTLTRLPKETDSTVHTTHLSTNAGTTYIINRAQSKEKSLEVEAMMPEIIFGSVMFIFLISVTTIAIYFKKKLRVCCSMCSPCCKLSPLFHIYESVDDIRITNHQYVNQKDIIEAQKSYLKFGYITPLDINNSVRNTKI